MFKDLSQRVALVDDNDLEIGTYRTADAHKHGLLHRAHSIFIFQYKNNNEFKLLLQKRHPKKCHSKNLWSNTCSGHPQPHCKINAEARKQLLIELGIDCPLHEIGEFTYQAHIDGLIEHEYNHVLIGFILETEINHNPQEVSKTKWIDIKDLLKAMKATPEHYTHWFTDALNIAIAGLKKHKGYLLESKPSFKHFSRLNYNDRLQTLNKAGYIDQKAITHLKTISHDDLKLADALIENAIGTIHVPMGVAVNLKIDDIERVVPMAVEETSIIAAVCKNAKWIRENGYIATKTLSNYTIGQIYIMEISHPEYFINQINNHKNELLEMANTGPAHSMKARGGGVTDIQVRLLKTKNSNHRACIHVHVDTCDSMGANIVNQVCEFLKKPIVKLTETDCLMCILSNYATGKLVSAKVTLNNIEPKLGHRIAEASMVASLDPGLPHECSKKYRLVFLLRNRPLKQL